MKRSNRKLLIRIEDRLGLLSERWHAFFLRANRILFNLNKTRQMTKCSELEHGQLVL